MRTENGTGAAGILAVTGIAFTIFGSGLALFQGTTGLGIVGIVMGICILASDLLLLRKVPEPRGFRVNRQSVLTAMIGTLGAVLLGFGLFLAVGMSIPVAGIAISLFGALILGRLITR